MVFGNGSTENDNFEINKKMYERHGISSGLVPRKVHWVITYMVLSSMLLYMFIFFYSHRRPIGSFAELRLEWSDGDKI